jgi:hypothetical protein
VGTLYLPDGLRFGRVELALEEDEEPAEAEEHVEAVVLGHVVVELAVEHRQDLPQLRQLHPHPHLLSLKVIRLTSVRRRGGACENLKKKKKKTSVALMKLVRIMGYHVVHESLEAPEGVHLV